VQAKSFMVYVLGRNFCDGNGGPRSTRAANPNLGNLISTYVDYQTPKHAGFYPQENVVKLGRGDGLTYGPLTSLDIVAHEWTHCLIHFVLNLSYQNESGSLHESISDVFGAMAERYWKGENVIATATNPNLTWKMAELAYSPTIDGDASRHLDDPTINDYPACYADRVAYDSSGGGVHKNSTITSYAFYLLAQGGNAKGTCQRLRDGVSGIGADKATAIWWYALRYNLTSTANFSNLRKATIDAAKSLYGNLSIEAVMATRAWNAVGVPAP